MFVELLLECTVTHFVLATLMRALANNIGHSSDWQVEAGRSRLFPSSNGMESSTVIFLQQPWEQFKEDTVSKIVKKTINTH